jgi:hypothetical protein
MIEIVRRDPSPKAPTSVVIKMVGARTSQATLANKARAATGKVAALIS